MPHLIVTTLLILGCCVTLAKAVVAQTGEAGINVLVKDQFGGTIADAIVVLERAGAKAVEDKTDTSGKAGFVRLAAGEYRLSVTAAGFTEYKRESIVVRPGHTQTLEVVLEIAPIESNVDISQLDDLNPEKASLATVLGEREVAELPDDPEELERTLKRIGQAVTGEDLPVTVNGVQGGKIPPKAAIQQIRINQNVFSAQYDGPYGGGIEIFTRPNVTKFRTFVSFGFADGRLNAADPFLQRRVPYQSKSLYFNSTGPLVGKKASFFVYGSLSGTDSSAVINAVILDADLRPAAFRQTFSTPGSSENVNFTINADPNKKHKLYFNYGLGLGRSKGQNVGGFLLPSRANDNESQNHSFQFSETYLVDPDIVNQSRAFLYYTSNNSFGGSTDPAINVLDSFFGGGSQQNSTNKNLRFEVSNETTWQMGRYALGFGARFRGETIDQNSTANFGGTYTFSGRLAPVLDANNQPVPDGSGGFLTEQINSLESYRRTLVFRAAGYSDQLIRELGGGANQLTVSGGNPSIKLAQYDLGVYLQNSYKISETIAASFGLRYENQTNIGSSFNFAPRFGVTWSPKGKDKQNPLFALPRVSVGYGLFYSRFGLNNTLNVKLASDPDRAQYLITDTGILDLFPAVPSSELLQQFALPRTQRLIADGFESPYQSLLNFNVLKKLPKGFTLNFSYSHSKFLRQNYTQNINAPLAGTFDPLDPSTAVRPFGNVGNIYQTRSFGRTDNDRVSVNLNFPQSQTLFASLRYGYAKTRSNVVSGSGSPFDPYDFSQDFGPTPYDGIHSGGGYFYYSLPAHKINIGGDFNISTGTRFNIITGRDTNGDGYYSERPAFASDPTKPGVISTVYGLLDPDPSPGDKLIPRNLGRGPSSVSFNASISKSIGFNEDRANKKPAKQTLNFGVRISNVLNIVNKGNPVGNMSSPNFLKTLSGYSDGGIYIINGMQQYNFAGRSLSFNVGFSF